MIRAARQILTVGLCFPLLFVGSFALGAMELRLFDFNGRQVDHYTDKITSVKPGDTIICEDKTYRVGYRLGAGGTTQIFEFGNGFALRLPKFGGHLPGSTDTYLDFSRRFHRGQRKLMELGIPTPRVSEEMSLSEKCIVVEKFVARFSAWSLLRYMVKGPTTPLRGLYGELISNEEIEIAYDRLLKFLKTTWKVRSVQDLHIDNVLWTTQGWLAVDSEDAIAEAQNPRQRGTIVNAWNNSDMKKLLQELDQMILDERARQGARAAWSGYERSPSDLFEMNVREQSEGLIDQLPQFNKKHFMNVAPELLGTQGRTVIESIPRIWFIERIRAHDGIENYFARLPGYLQEDIISGLGARKKSPQDFNLAGRLTAFALLKRRTQLEKAAFCSKTVSGE